MQGQVDKAACNNLHIVSKFFPSRLSRERKNSVCSKELETKVHDEKSGEVLPKKGFLSLKTAILRHKLSW